MAKPFSDTMERELNKSLAEMIAEDLQPFSIVEDRGFRRFCNKLQPRYCLPSRTHLRNKVTKNIYEETRGKVLSELENAKFVSLTTDAWTSRATENYVTVTAHFLDETWKLKTYVLETKEMGENHTADNLADCLLCVIKEWKLDSKETLYVTTDNAANIVKACKIAQLPHMPCFAHTLNLSVQKGLGVTAVSNALAHIRFVVKFFHTSTLGTASLHEAQVNMGLEKHKLVLDCPTRWNSTYEMVTVFKEQYSAIAVSMYNHRLAAADLRALRNHMDKIPEEDLTCLCDVLKPFYDATNLLSGEKYPTVGLVQSLKAMLLEK